MLGQLLLTGLLYYLLVNSEDKSGGVVEAVGVKFWMSGFLRLVASMYLGAKVDESVELVGAPVGASESEEVLLTGGLAASSLFGLLAYLYAISYNLLG